MSINEYAQYDALGLAELVRTGQVSATELLDEALRRVERHNPALNAVVFRADELAHTWAKTPAQGPFQGVPLLLKDVLGLCEGMPTRMGSRSTPSEPSRRDSEIVARFRRAGFVPFAKSNAPEFGLMPTTESLFYGAAHNPWNLAYTPGGSSGGSAAAVAAGIVPLAHANDGGGSIRIPSSLCGLVGLKPTRGRVSLAPGSDPSGLVIEHVVTRSVRDSAAVLDAIAGSVPGDFALFPPPGSSFLDALAEPLAPQRIAVVEQDPQGKPYASECSDALRATADRLAQLGHHVEAARPGIDGPTLSFAFRQLWYSNAAVMTDGLALLSGQAVSVDNHDPLTWAMVEAGRAITSTQYQIARFLLDGATRRLAYFMKRFDLVLTPTLSTPPFELGHLDLRSSDLETEMNKTEAIVGYTPVANAAGVPAISLPLCTSKAGMPIGMQFMAAAGEEALLLRLAKQLERVMPWARRRPVVWD
jgi:amidase